jgi:hypothetical protein
VTALDICLNIQPWAPATRCNRARRSQSFCYQYVGVCLSTRKTHGAEKSTRLPRGKPRPRVDLCGQYVGLCLSIGKAHARNSDATRRTRILCQVGDDSVWLIQAATAGARLTRPPANRRITPQPAP